MDASFNITDQLNRELYFKETPVRIVSLVPSQTELLVDLGLEDSIVGATKFCTHPKHLRKSTTIVGGTKDIKIEKVKALTPDIILCNKEENTKAIVEACSSICPVHVSDIYSIEDCLKLIYEYGIIFSIRETSKNLIQSIQLKRDDFRTFIEKRKTKKVAYFIWRSPWMVVGGNTYINHMLELNGFENVFKNFERYPEVKIEELNKLNLDYVLLSSEPYPFKNKHIEEIKNLVSGAKTLLVDGKSFSWYGSRLLKAFGYFKVLHNGIEAH